MCFSKSQHRRVAVLISTFPACIKLLLLLVWCTIYNFADSYDIQMWHSRRRRMSFTSACKNSDPLLNTFRNNLEFVGKEVTLSSQKKILWYFTMVRHNLILWMLAPTFILLFNQQEITTTYTKPFVCCMGEPSFDVYSCPSLQCLL